MSVSECVCVFVQWFVLCFYCECECVCVSFTHYYYLCVIYLMFIPFYTNVLQFL
eukprot:m.118654 g.118654  ORF g.118654 m.118654 type:complete len:54 (-) comp12899_c0_seq9:67-228(-)